LAHLRIAFAVCLIAGACSAARIEGQWQAFPEPHSESIRIELRREVIVGARRSILVAPPERNESQAGFTLVRDAGTIHFSGTLREGNGTFRFEPSRAFRDRLRPLAPDWWDEEKLLEMTLRSVPLQYITELGAAGYTGAGASDVIRLHTWEVPPERSRQPFGPILNLSQENRARLRSLGVNAEYIKRMSETGYLLSAEEVERLHGQGVSADLLRQMKLSGHDGLGVSDMLRLQTHGVTSFDLQKMQAQGHTNLSVDEIIGLKNNGQQ
jgi:hypothetical protein